MENVFDKILKSRPNTFIVFGSSGPIVMGVSPMPHSAAGLSYSSGHFLPGGLSGYATGAGALTLNGKLCSSPHEGGHGSIEMIIMKNEFNSTSTDTIVDIPNFLSLTRWSEGLNSSYIMTVMGEEVINVPTSPVPGLQHLVINIEGQLASLIVNGKTYSGMMSEESVFAGADHSEIIPGGDRLWGVVIRPVSISEEYCHEIVELINSFPQPAEAEAPFNPVTFVYDHHSVRDSTVFRLEDLSYPDVPEESMMYNGSKMSEMEVAYTEGWLNIPDTEFMKYLIIDTEVVEAAVIGSEFEGSDVTEESSSIDGFEEFSTFSSPNDGVVEISNLNQEVIGSPERVLVIHPSSLGFDDVPRSMELIFTPEVVSIESTSIPDRDVVVDPSGTFIGQAQQFSGGFRGVSTILPDDDFEVDSVYPQAYGMWVYLAGGSVSNLATNGTFSIKSAADTSLTIASISYTYVDGTLYTSGPVGVGWHFISFIPSSGTNLSITVGAASSSNIIYTFSLLHAPTPTAYMTSLYRSYVNPVSIRPTTPDTMSILDSGADIYSHDWSISSAD